MSTLSPTEKQLLNLLQKEFPLEPRPFAVLAAKVGLTEDEVLAKVAQWRESGVLRRLGPVFDSKRIGYKSLLVALSCPEAQLNRVTEIINAYPGVTHNYLRETTDGWHLGYNVWFTMTGATSEEVQSNLNEISAKTGLTDMLPLPAHRLFKIRVQFDLEDTAEERRDSTVKVLDESPMIEELTAADWQLIEAFQTELSPMAEPFAPAAAEVGLDTDSLLQKVARLQEIGVIRRFGATLKHFAVGFGSNAMGVWAVPPAQEGAVGEVMASFKAVSHCYARPTYPQWPYSLYTMIHAGSRDECREIAEAISEATGVTDYHLLFTVKELKKKRMIYRAPRRIING